MAQAGSLVAPFSLGRNEGGVMNPIKFLILVLIFSLTITAVLTSCSDDETGEWEPVPDDDDDDDAGDDDDDDDCDCEVTEEQWQDLLDECGSVLGALYEMFDDPTAESLCEACDPCLVGCFREHDYCTTPFVDCFWDCAEAASGR